MGFEWTELTYQQILASKDILTKLAFPLGVVFVFLVLAAQYESWSLPLAIILIVPMCLLAAVTGVWLAELDNNIFVQIGLVVLIGLAAKNAILDRRVRQAARRFRQAAIRSDGRRLPLATAADPDDVVRVHPGRRSAGAGHRCRRGNAVHAGAGRLQRHAGRDDLRHLLHAGLLLRRPLVQRKTTTCTGSTAVRSARRARAARGRMTFAGYGDNLWQISRSPIFSGHWHSARSAPCRCRWARSSV